MMSMKLAPFASLQRNTALPRKWAIRAAPLTASAEPSKSCTLESSGRSATPTSGPTARSGRKDWIGPPDRILFLKASIGTFGSAQLQNALTKRVGPIPIRAGVAAGGDAAFMLRLPG